MISSSGRVFSVILVSNVFLDLNLDQLRMNFVQYTRQAFHMLPLFDHPRILDIGCGSGIPTLELAQLSDGEIIAIDIDQLLLDQLAQKVEVAGLSTRVQVIKCSLFEITFPDESFDIVWTEGVIGLIGFAKGVANWRRLISPDGFLVVHDDSNDLAKKLQVISDCGYQLFDYFLLPEDAWWNDYYCPLELHLNQLTKKYSNNPSALKQLNEYRYQIDLARKHPTLYQSAFFLMQKM
jgi:ubiquinone/menaquinone biosynthesis C-methylase UbiE